MPALAVALAGVVFVGAPGTAHAQETDPIDITVQVLRDPGDDPLDNDSWRDMTDTETKEFFNVAHCECGTPVRLELELVDTMLSDATPLEVWLGARCADTTDGQRDSRCLRLETFTFSTTSIFHRVIVGTNLLMWPPDGACLDQEVTRNVFVLQDEGGDGVYESTSTSEDLSVDSALAPAVGNTTLEGGENAIKVSWDLPTEGADDIRSFQVLCAVNGQPALLEPASEPDYEVCATTPPIGPMPDGGLPDAGPADAGPDGGAIDAGPVDAAPAVDATVGPDAGMATGSIDTLDRRFICSGKLGAGSDSVRVSLPDVGPDDEVTIVLVETDDHKNPRAIPLGTASVQPVTDFWETYDEFGGEAEGGFCFVATAAYGSYDHPFVVVLRDFRDQTLAQFGVGRAFIRWYYRSSPPLADFIARHPVARVAAQILLWPVVVAAGAWEYTTALDKLVLLTLLVLAVLRRRQRKLGRRLFASHRQLAAAVTTLVLLVTGARGASAQAVYDEDWAEAEREQRSLWTFELKFGPYVPGIDGEKSSWPDGPPEAMGKGPYEFMYGDDWSLMGQIELDRYFVFPAGQLGVTGGAGYMKNTAAAFLLRADGVTPDYRMRSKADDTTFTLLPLSLGAVYRYTQLADRTYVPLVPYVKIGLSYYLWWVTKGDGAVTSTAMNGDAYGGTLGFQGTIGLSVRADRIDPTAARNLQTEMGVEHAGFFVEGTYADVSGLGQSRKLHVGDLTWFAGVNFEF